MSKVSRSGGGSAVASAAYRSGEDLEDERTGEHHDYTRRSGVEHSEIIGWEGTRSELWNAAEAAERRCDSVVAREMVYALPHELSPEARVALSRDIAREIRGMTGGAVDLNVHAPSHHPKADERNHHVHFQWTARAVDDAGEFAAKKDDPFSGRDGPELVRGLRATCADLTNGALEREARDARVDHRSYEDQDRDLPPELHRFATEHVGKARTARDRRGEVVDVVESNRELLEHNRALADPVERYCMLEASLRPLADEAHALLREQHDLEVYGPKAEYADAQIARATQDFHEAFARVFKRPEKARAAWDRCPPSERLRLLREAPETFGKLREVETGRGWLTHTHDAGEAARTRASQAVDGWEAAVAVAARERGAAAAAATRIAQLKEDWTAARGWRAAVVHAIAHLERGPEVQLHLTRARQREVLELTRERTRGLGNDLGRG